MADEIETPAPEVAAPAAPEPAAAPVIAPAVGGMASAETIAQLTGGGSSSTAAAAVKAPTGKAKADEKRRSGRPPVYGSPEQRKAARRKREQDKREAKKAGAAGKLGIGAPAAAGAVTFTAADLNPVTGGSAPMIGPVMTPGAKLPDPAAVAAMEPYTVMFVGAITAFMAKQAEDVRWRADRDEAESIGKPLAAVVILLFGSGAAASGPYAALVMACAMYAMPRLDLLTGQPA